MPSFNNTTIRNERAEPDFGRLDDEVAALIKGMIKRGDKQSDIAACFMLNSGRVAEINNKQKFKTVVPALELPPAGPYPSPYDIWKSQQELRRARIALEAADAAIQVAVAVIKKAEQR